MARKIVRNSKGSRKTIRTYQEGGIIGGGTQSIADREDERIGDDTEGMYQKGGVVTDVMGGKYTRTDKGKKVNEDTYIDYAHEYGYTPSKKEVRKYKRKVRKGKL